MAKKAGNNTKCQNYLSSRKRIKNKTHKLEKRLKFSTMKTEAKENIIKACRIGRKLEGFNPESAKQKLRKNENNRNS